MVTTPCALTLMAAFSATACLGSLEMAWTVKVSVNSWNLKEEVMDYRYSLELSAMLNGFT